MKVLVYNGTFPTAEVYGLVFVRGEPTPVPGKYAEKMLRNSDFTVFQPAPPPPATEPVVTAVPSLPVSPATPKPLIQNKN